VKETEHRQSRGSGERMAGVAHGRSSAIPAARDGHGFYHPCRGSQTGDNLPPQLALWARFWSPLPRLHGVAALVGE
jgi:hypothetical protein